MKTVLAILLCCCTLARALDLTVECDPADAELQVTGYVLYEWTAPGTAVKVATSATPVFTVANVVPGVHIYEVRLVNLWGESAAFATGKTPPLPSVPQVNPLRFKLVTIETSENMQDWQVIGAVAVADVPRAAFYRIGFSPN